MRRRRAIRELTDDDIARKANIDNSDKAKAKAAWKRHAPARFRNLLDAKPAPVSPKKRRGR